ncbi:MAG: adenosylmethionine-8-amino-7-oxononanoate aminotransferase [Lysobacterales bacterium]|jgi:adenosylmethionine-8-amino-7-oxononanoate aminotransferase
MTGVFYREPQHQYPLAVRGEGVYLYDDQGKQYLDGSGGAAISCLGHGHSGVISAVHEQLKKMAFAHTAFFTNQPQEDLSRILSDQFGEPGAKVYFLSGGSESNETALKLARQYWVAVGRKEKKLMISRDQSYHGNTLGALSVTGNRGRQEIYGPLLKDWPKISPCYAYRHQRADETECEYGLRSALELEEKIIEAGAENVAAFIAETIVGATLGAVPAVEGYFEKIREICDRYEVLLILDEVMAGRGRTGTWFAFEQEGFTPDIVTVAKALGGGYQPIGAVICRGYIHDHIVEACGSFEHGHTYVGHATGCAAGVAVAKIIEEQNLLSNVQEMGKTLKNALESEFKNHPNVGDIRGRGMFLGVELVSDRMSKSAIGSIPQLPLKIRNTAMRNGLICYPGGGTVNGVDGAHVLLAPPFIYNNDHVSELVGKLSATFKEVLGV